MGLLMDIRSSKRDKFGLGVYAIIFWILAGSAIAAGIGAYSAVASGKAMLIFASIGAVIGLCFGFYAAFGDTRLANALALPGLLIAMLGAVG
jgi:hypothetical protein